MVSYRTIANDALGGGGGEGLGLGKMFSDPNLLGKLAANPRTSKHLADPAFVQRLKMIQQNPRLADSALSGDARMIDVLGALMGIDMQGFGRDEGSDTLPPGVSPTSPPTSPQSQSKPTFAQRASSSSSKTPPPAAKVEEEDVEMDDADDEEAQAKKAEAQAKKAAEAEKKLGAEAYKTREFEAAATHFSKAWELWPKDITFLTNLGGMSFCSSRELFVHGTDCRFSCLL